jgi:sugar lactone lactonase YvrE
VAVDANYIYVADTENHRVQIFNRNTLAYVATIGGSYGTGNNQFKFPTDVAVDAAGNIYVADYANKRVQKYNSSRIYQRTYGTTGVSYVASNDRFYYPEGVAVGPDGSIYVVEGYGHRLVKLNAAGVPQWTVGEAGQPGDDNAHFGYLRDVAVGPDGRIYTIEAWSSARYAPGSNHRLQIFNPDGSYYGGFGGYGSGNYQFIAPHGIAIDQAGKVYIADRDNHRVQIYNSQLAYVATLGQTGVPGSDNSHFNYPFDVAVDRNGTIYVADEGNDRIQVFDSNLQYVRTIGGGGTGSDFGHFDGWGPHHLAVDSQGRLYVVDSGNQRVQVFDNFANSNAYLTTIGGRWGTEPGRFSNILGIAIGPDDSVYTSEIHNNHRIQKFAPGVPGWKQVNINGFGDRTNGNIHALASFGGQLYAGTYNSSTGAQLWRMSANGTWTQPNNRLYIGTTNWANGGEVWKKTVTADFTASPLIGLPGTTVTFTNLSGGDVVTATWNFGDGSPALTVNHTGTVTHTYTTPGVYTVTLTVEDGVDTDVRTRAAYIQIAHQIFLPLIQRAYNPLIALYDDFNNPAFDGFYNPLKWQFWGDENYFTARQQGGVLMITNTPSTPADVGLDLPLAMPMERTLRQVQRFQARMKW